MFGKIIAGTTLAGVLAFGTAGIAGATTTSTSSTPSSRSTPSKPANPLTCSFLQQIQPQLQAFARDLSDAATQTQNVESAAKAAGFPKLANGLAKRAQVVEARAKQISKRFKRAEARCGLTSGATSNTGSTNTGSGSTGSTSTSTTS
jgi:hypothetical protein